ncbi:hypothetical protein [Duganella lactea]|uniref:hypothetical protein n=1 Tax=Duganella lactea TaxID=2692173 RepID=UPI001E2A6ED2|nr:hypothetical protein [Duganella lactea]
MCFGITNWRRLPGGPLASQCAPVLPEPSTQRREWHAHAAALRSAHHLRRHLLAAVQDELAIEELVLQLINLKRKNTAAPTLPMRATYRRVLDRISAEFDRSLTIAELAAAENKMPIVFLREFSTVLGMMPHAFIVEHRVQAARAMIKRGDTPLLMSLPLAASLISRTLARRFAKSWDKRLGNIVCRGGESK